MGKTLLIPPPPTIILIGLIEAKYPNVTLLLPATDFIEHIILHSYFLKFRCGLADDSTHESFVYKPAGSRAESLLCLAHFLIIRLFGVVF